MDLFELFHKLFTFEDLVIVHGELCQQLNHKSVFVGEEADEHRLLEGVEQHLVLLHDVVKYSPVDLALFFLSIFDCFIHASDLLSLAHLFDLLVNDGVPHFYVLLGFARENPVTCLILEFYTMLILVFGRHILEVLYPRILELDEVDLFLARFLVVKEPFTEQNELSLLERILVEGLFIQSTLAFVIA